MDYQSNRDSIMETDIIWILLFIGYAIGLIPIAYFGIVGTNDIINSKNYENKSWQIWKLST